MTLRDKYERKAYCTTCKSDHLSMIYIFDDSVMMQCYKCGISDRIEPEHQSEEIKKRVAEIQKIWHS